MRSSKNQKPSLFSFRQQFSINKQPLFGNQWSFRQDKRNIDRFDYKPLVRLKLPFIKKFSQINDTTEILFDYLICRKSMQTHNNRGILDYAGAFVAGLCAVHCLAMPFLLTVLPLLGLSFLADETTEWMIIFASIILALFSLIPAFRHHRKYRVLLLFAAGIGLIIVSHQFFEDDFFLKVATTSVGAILLISAHLSNRRCCQNN
jgi:hypothetical protein